MDYWDVQRGQVLKMAEHLRPAMVYLGKLRSPIEQRGFLPDDKLYRRVSEAYNAMNGLCVTLHYLSCEHGVGEPPKRGTCSDSGRGGAQKKGRKAPVAAAASALQFC